MNTLAQSLLPNQFTVRLGDSELEYINENLHLIRGEDVEMPRSKIFVTALTKAIQNQPKVKEIIKDNPEHLAKIEEQQQALDNLQAMFDNVQQIVEQMQNEALNLPPGAIVLNLPPKIRRYFWSVLYLSKKTGHATSYEDLLTKMFEVFHARNEYLFSPEDIEELKNVEYDGPAEN